MGEEVTALEESAVTEVSNNTVKDRWSLFKKKTFLEKSENLLKLVTSC